MTCDIARYALIFSHIDRYFNIFPNISRYCPILSNIVQYCEILFGTAKHFQFLIHVNLFIAMIAYCHNFQILSNIGQ